MNEVRLGIVGYGNMGSSHVRSMLMGRTPELVLSAVCDIDPARIDACRKDTEGMFDSVQYFEDYGAMLDAKVCDAILIATPHFDHPPMAIRALENGYHVMVEKPAGVYTSAVKEMNKVAEDHPDQVFGMMFNQRNNPVYRKMKEILESGELGPIRRTNWLITSWYRSQSYYDSGNWRATWAGEGGGVLLNQCPHNLDLWQWICGMPQKVRAFTHEGLWHDIEVEDDVTCYVEYPNGATGVFVTSTGDTPGTNRFEVLLDGGKLVATAEKLTLYKLETPNSEFNRTYDGGFGEPAYETIEVELEGEDTQHVGVLNAFSGAILRGEPLTARGEEGINGLTLSNAMHLSSWLDETIELPLDEYLFKAELEKRIAASSYDPNARTEAKTLDTEGTYGSK